MGKGSPKNLGRAWKEVRAAFEEAIELAPEERGAWLTRLAKQRPKVHAEVVALLAKAATQEGTPLDAPLMPRLAAEARTRTVPPATEFTPTWFGSYLLVDILGRGGMAEVFLAKAVGPAGYERLVAIKRVSANQRGNEDAMALFEYEARLSSRLSHSNIVHVYDFRQEKDTYFLTMELVNGRNLSQLAERCRERKRRLPRECALFIVAETCRALQYAFELVDESTGSALRVIHRDVTPRNVMVSYAGEVKVLDFGIAKAADRRKLTQSGLFRGTVGYLPPEVAAGGEADQRGDVFSAAVLLYELLTGDELFAMPSALQSLRLVQDCEIPAERIAASKLDAKLKQLLRRALSKDPASRHASAGELLAELDRCLGARARREAPGKLRGLMRDLFGEEMKAERERRDAVPLPAGDVDKITAVIERDPSMLAKSRPRFWYKTAVGVLVVIATLAWFRSQITTRILAQVLQAKAPAVLWMGRLVMNFNARCGDEMKRYCNGSASPPVIVDCLLNVDEHLSNGCRQQLLRVTPKSNCYQESRQLCSAEKWGEGMTSCLERQVADVSDACRDYLKRRIPGDSLGD